ncbi:MAG: hypothetical protein E4H14_11020 [Candidatus Thorarchaeota archaeon]|nr:MAG: hypothetical protein E4H14_11020 [Candidatus Thorarchaeota archaeon]
MIKGCPCYRQFGDEKVCLNNDDVIPINAISVDPSFFEQIRSKEELAEYKSDKESMCYLLMFLDRKGGLCYCISQGQNIVIDKKDVKAAEINSALQFVTTTDRNRDGVVCSDCLYKYLRTLGEASEGFLTDSEREELVASYVKDVSTRMAAELSGYSANSYSDEKYEQHVRLYIKKLNQTRSQWASLTLKLREKKGDKVITELVDHYRDLHRLEAIFLFQVLSLTETMEETDTLETLRFMVGVSEKVIQLSDMIREKTYDLLERKAMSEDLQKSLRKHSEKRKETEYKFSNLVKVLSEISAHTSV